MAVFERGNTDCTIGDAGSFWKETWLVTLLGLWLMVSTRLREEECDHLSVADPFREALTKARIAETPRPRLKGARNDTPQSISVKTFEVVPAESMT
jgi:hypothetical protein